jgi:hypothetical protein
MEHEYTFLRFEVELNLPEFPEDDGDAISEKSAPRLVEYGARL